MSICMYIYTCIIIHGGYVYTTISIGSIISWRILCSFVLVMTCFLIRDCNILPKKELHRSLQV